MSEMKKQHREKIEDKGRKTKRTEQEEMEEDRRY
jgi:hypothetical protein